MKKIILLVVSLMLIVFAGCGHDDGPFFSHEGDLEIYNGSHYYVEAVYLARANSNDPWGPNQLDVHMHPGDYYTIHGIPDGLYDLKIVLDTGGEWTYHDIDIYGGLTTYFDVPRDVYKATVKSSGKSATVRPGNSSPYKPMTPEQITP
jgi:hypothetical protein